VERINKSKLEVDCMSKERYAKFVDHLKEVAESRVGYVPGQIEFLGEKLPEVVANFVRLYGSIMQKGALDVKTKELIGLGIAVALGCEHCMEWHTIGALRQGASEEEIAETLAVAIAMTGGPGLVTLPEPVIKALEKYKEKK